MTNHEAIVNAQLQANYGVSYAKAYAVCRDAGMGNEDAETAIAHLVQNLSLGRSPKHDSDSLRVHAILMQISAPEKPAAVVS